MLKLSTSGIRHYTAFIGAFWLLTTLNVHFEGRRTQDDWAGAHAGVKCTAISAKWQSSV
jgi:hypothetical protein